MSPLGLWDRCSSPAAHPSLRAEHAALSRSWSQQNVSSVDPPPAEGGAGPIVPVHQGPPPPWLALNISRAAAVEIIAAGPDGAFLVRASETRPGQQVLSYLYGSRVEHDFILEDRGQFALRSCPELQFESLEVLVKFFHFPRPQLPCPLRSDYLEDQRVVSNGGHLALGSWPPVGSVASQGPRSLPDEGHSAQADADARWKQLSLRSPDVIPMLQGSSNGTFLVHGSQGTRPSAVFVLTYAFDSFLHQQSIAELPGGRLALESFPQESFATLRELAAFFCVNQGPLLCLLRADLMAPGDDKPQDGAWDRRIVTRPVTWPTQSRQSHLARREDRRAATHPRPHGARSFMRPPTVTFHASGTATRAIGNGGGGTMAGASSYAARRAGGARSRHEPSSRWTKPPAGTDRRERLTLQGQHLVSQRVRDVVDPPRSTATLGGRRGGRRQRVQYGTSGTTASGTTASGAAARHLTLESMHMYSQGARGGGRAPLAERPLARHDNTRNRSRSGVPRGPSKSRRDGRIYETVDDEGGVRSGIRR